MKRTPLRRRSAKTAARDRRYARERVEFLAAHPLCEIGWDAGCTAAAVEVHHMAGRAASVFFDRSRWAASCSHCHRQATENPAEAYRRGVSLHRNQAGAA